MSTAESPGTSSPTLSTRAWWAAQRLSYNVGMVIAGMTAFVVYCLVLAIFGDVIRDVDVTLFTTLFQGVGYLLCMGCANILYYLGPLSELLLRPPVVERYRRVTFALGFWFSVALPFSIPALLTFLALFFPQYFRA